MTDTTHPSERSPAQHRRLDAGRILTSCQTRRVLRAFAVAAAAVTALSGCTLPLLGAVVGGPATTPAATGASSASTAGAGASVASPAPLPPAGPAPALATTGTSMSSVLPSLITYGQWLVANPSAASHIGDIAVPGCPVEQQLTQRLASLASAGAHDVPPATTIVVSTTGSTSGSPNSTTSAGSATTGTTSGKATTSGTVTVTATLTRDAEPTVSYAGGQISGSPALAGATADFTLQLGSDKRWRLCSVQALDVPGDDTVDDLLNIF